MPVTNEVSAADNMMPPTFARFSGRAAAPNRNRSGRQSPHFEEITAGHISCRRITGDEARDLAVNFFAGSRVEIIAGLEKERHVPDVMQSEWNQRALDDAVDGEGERRLSVRSPIRKCFDAVADRRPDETEQRADDDDFSRGDDRDGTFAGEKPEIGRQLYLIKAIERARCDQPDNDARRIRQYRSTGCP